MDGPPGGVSARRRFFLGRSFPLPPAHLRLEEAEDAKPLSTFVYARYAGYSSPDEPFPVVVRSNEEGMADIEISQLGVWMIVANHKVDFSASLTLEIK